MERRILESAEMGREAARRRGLRAEGAASRRSTRRGATAAREARSAAPGVMPGARAEAVARAGAADAATPRAAIIAGVIAPIILRGLATAPPRCMQRTDVAEGESFIARRFLAKSGVGARGRARSVGEGDGLLRRFDHVRGGRREARDGRTGSSARRVGVAPTIRADAGFHSHHIPRPPGKSVTAAASTARSHQPSDQSQ